MLKKLLSLARVSLLLSIALSAAALSQTGQTGQTGQPEQTGKTDQESNSSQPGQKTEKGQNDRQQTTVVTQKSKAANESCDGALNIVPTKSMTFTRKRRPSRSEEKQKPSSEKDRESKQAERQTGDVQKR